MMNVIERFDRLLKAMVQGEPPKRKAQPDERDAQPKRGEKPKAE